MEDSMPDFLRDDCDDYADTVMSADSSGNNDKSAIEAVMADGLPCTGDEEQRKTRRRIANRESARRTRQRKADMLRSLSTEVMKLNSRNVTLQNKLAFVSRQCQKTNLENQMLRQHLQELSMSASLQIQGLSPMFNLGSLDMPQLAPALNTGKVPPPCSIPPSLDLLTPSLCGLPHLNLAPPISSNPLSLPLLPLAEAPPPTPVTPAANASLPSIPSTPHSPANNLNNPNNFSHPLPLPGDPDLELAASYWAASFGEDAAAAAAWNL